MAEFSNAALEAMESELDHNNIHLEEDGLEEEVSVEDNPQRSRTHSSVSE